MPKNDSFQFVYQQQQQQQQEIRHDFRAGFVFVSNYSSLRSG